MVGIGLLICAALVASNTNDFLKSSVVVSGRVVELSHGPNHPTIAFVTQSGEHISFPDGGFLPSLGIDDQVPVRYKPDAPLQTAKLDFFGPIWGNALVLLGFGLSSLLGSLLNFYLQNRSEKKCKIK
ncbi:DUF3592 domain-containing protein [Caballeronia sp. KNU42]